MTEAMTQQPALSEVERVVDTFIAPEKTFHDILRSTRWWLPFLLSVLVGLAFVYTVEHQVGWMRVVENAMHQSPKQEEQLASLTPEQRAERMPKIAAGYRITSYGYPLLVLLFAAIGAMFLWASFNFGLGTRMSFGQMFSVWMYASLPKVLAAVIAMVVLWIGGNSDSFDIKNPVGTNLAYYMPDASPAMRAGLAFFDVMGIWMLVLMVIGTAIVAGVSRGKAAAVVVGWWVLVLILSVAATAAFA